MFSETQLTPTIKETFAFLASKGNLCDYTLTYHKRFYGDVGLLSPEAETSIADYQKVSITDAELRYLKNADDQNGRP